MKRRLWLVVPAVVLVAALIWLARSRDGAKGGATAAGGPAARPVPVVAATVARRDVPVFLEGIGTVAALKTVTVRTQVDGRLDQVLFKEGQAVRRGDLLARIDPRPFLVQLQQAEGALARDRAQLLGARLNLERYKSLQTQKLIASQQVDDQVALVGQLDGTVLMDMAAIDSARLNLDYARITSPIDGLTGIRSVDPGNVVHGSDPAGLVVVTQLDPVAILFSIPQDQLTPLVEAMAGGALAVDAFARDGSTLLGTGELALIDNQINQATSTLRLKAIVPNARRLLWPNQFVKARLRLTTRRDALVMPGTAVQRGPGGTFVYVIAADGTVSPRPVEIAAVEGDLAVVGQGLQEGERVVVDGQNQLRAGSKVAPRDQERKAGGSRAEGGTGEATSPGTAAR